MSDFAKLDERFSALLYNLEPAQRRKLARDVANQLRAANQKQVAAQLNPDGKPFEPRKLRQKNGSIRRTMFNKLRLAKWLKVQATPEIATVEFINRVQHIAQVHHYGLRDRVFKDRQLTAKYAPRELLGFNTHNLEIIRDTTIAHIAKS